MTNLSQCIGVYENIVPKEVCNALIKWFEKSLTVRVDDHRKQSTELQIIGDPRPEARFYSMTLFKYIRPLGEIYEREMYDLCDVEYKPADEPLTRLWGSVFNSLQIQKYTPEDKGYPAVHLEAGPDHIKKFLAVILYLNDVQEGGGTIFPAAGTTIQPEAGKVVIWPTGIPFYHCGNRSKSDKYIITTWFEFI